MSSIISLAKTHGVDLPSYQPNVLAGRVHIQDKTPNLLAFLDKLNIGVSVLGDADACEQIAFENVEDAKNEGLHYVELRFSPLYMAQAFGLSLHAVVDAVVSGIKRANRVFNYKANLIGILSRTYGVDACQRELEALLSFSSDLVAIDLAGDEKGFPCCLFTQHFKQVRDAGLKVTIHAGEADGPGSIWDAINLLGANRIGHGVCAFQDGALMDYMLQHQIGIESCILSNYQTGTWTEISQHPVQIFLEKGMLVSLNTDDPGVSNNTLLSEYDLARTQIKLSDDAISTLKQNAVKQSFIDNDFKQRLMSLE